MARELKDQSGRPVLRQGLSVLETELTGSVVKDVSIEDRTLRIRGTDESTDRDGDIIRVSGWTIKNYLKNPVFLWAHNYSSVPVGKTIQLVRRRQPEPHLDFLIKFPSKGVYPFADMILNLYAEKVINASSVGFLPAEWERLEKDDPERDPESPWNPYSRRYTQQDLLELSGVPVPANPNAIQNSLIGMGLDEKSVEMVSKGGIILPEDRKKVLAALDVEPLTLSVGGDSVLVQVIDDFDSKSPDEEEIPLEEPETEPEEKYSDSEGEEKFLDSLVRPEGQADQVVSDSLRIEGLEKTIAKRLDQLDKKIDKMIERLEKLEKGQAEATGLKESSSMYSEMFEAPEKGMDEILREEMNQLTQAVKNLQSAWKQR